jgi:hypothetical protein
MVQASMDDGNATGVTDIIKVGRFDTISQA